MAAPKKPRVRLYSGKLKAKLTASTVVRPVFFTEEEGGTWQKFPLRSPNRAAYYMLRDLAGLGHHSVLFDNPRDHIPPYKKGQMPLVRWDCVNGVTKLYGVAR